MKKLFISQPMRDKTDEEIKTERENIIKDVTNVLGEVEVIDSFFESAPHEAKPLWFLGKSLELLSTADIAYFAKDWDKYRGCEKCKQTKFFIIAAFWFAVLSIKYDGVDIQKRK